MKKIILNFIFLSALALTIPSLCSANAGIPVIFISYLPMLVALVAVIPAEAFILWMKLRGESGNQSNNLRCCLKSSAIANLVTTVVGFPLAWLFLLIVEILAFAIVGSMGDYRYILSSNMPLSQVVSLIGAWLGGGGDLSQIYFAVTVGWTINLIVAFFLSVWMESKIVTRFFKNVDKAKIKKAVLIANLVSYFLLIAVVALFSDKIISFLY